MGALLLSAGCRQVAGYGRADAAATDAAADTASADLGHDGAGKEGPPVVEGGRPPDTTAAPDPACATANLAIIQPDGSSYTGDTQKGSWAFEQLRCRHVSQPNTPWSGPQSYLGFVAKKEKWYRIEVVPQFEAFVYVFTSGCTQAAIELDCQSRGATGDSSRIRIAAQHRQAIYFQAPRDELVRIAVDSDDPAKSGLFELTVVELGAAPSSSCTDPIKLTIDASPVEGDIGPTLTKDEALACAAGPPLPGPQAFYGFSATAKQVYEIALEASAANQLQLRLLWDCNNASCTSMKPLELLAGQTGYLYVKPPSNHDYVLAVDSAGEHAYGRFKVSVRTLTPQTNVDCLSAVELTESLTLAGNTAWTQDTSSPTCGGASPRNGPELQYRFEVKTGRIYELELETSFESWPYVHSSTACGIDALIQSNCASNGVTGLDFGGFTAGQRKTAIFRPAPGTYHLVVDSLNNQAMGPFEVTLTSQTTLNEDPCAAVDVTPSAAGASLKFEADTRGLKDILGPVLQCGTGQWLTGPQRFYRLSTVAGASYDISLRPQFAGAALYLFGPNAICTDGLGLEASCSKPGQQTQPAQGQSATLHYTSATAADLFIGVDSFGDAGKFELTVARLP